MASKRRPIPHDSIRNGCNAGCVGAAGEEQCVGRAAGECEVCKRLTRSAAHRGSSRCSRCKAERG
ncbi:MAG: hypothetical protein KAR13_01980, partial [Desulfobulbaceae bacterium]|nr:hypothetical protein [Desulfobulbaceae bacterium]